MPKRPTTPPASDPLTGVKTQTIALSEIDLSRRPAGRLKDSDGASLDALVKEIALVGQLVPVVLRRIQNKNAEYRFEIIDGFRRIEALQALERDAGKPLRAVALVTEVAPARLALMQVRLNAHHRGQQFAERMATVLDLSDLGHKTHEIAQAMNLDDAEISRLRTCGRSLGRTLIARIGPAEGIGRSAFRSLAKAIDPGTARGGVALEEHHVERRRKTALYLYEHLSKSTELSVRKKLTKVAQELTPRSEEPVFDEELLKWVMAVYAPTLEGGNIVVRGPSFGDPVTDQLIMATLREAVVGVAEKIATEHRTLMS